MSHRPLTESASLLEVINAIQLSTEKLCLIVGGSGKLVGTVTDGDIRRALISGMPLSSIAADAMNASPETISEEALVSRRVGKQHSVDHVVVVDRKLHPIGFLSSSGMHRQTSAPIVLMAGGIGSRLLPLTADTPKPLIEIGGIPMIEILISRLAKQGFSNFFVAINHLGWQIEERLGTGEELGVNVQYLKEENTLGTAGALGLLRGAVDEPFLVANADLVTSCDFRALLDFHVASKSSATLGLREYVHEVPFGVVKLQGAHVANFEEKPLIREFVAAGIYCFDPSVIGTLHPPQHLDMPDLIGRLIEVESLNVAGFPIHEQWDDVGQLKDLERVRSHWKGASG